MYDPTTGDTPSAGIIQAAIIAALDEFGWESAALPGDFIQVMLAGRDAQYRMLLRGDDRLDCAVCYAVFPVKIPVDRRIAVAETVNRANWTLLLGNLEMDHSDGEIRFRVAVDVEGGVLVPQMVQSLVGAAIFAIDRFFPAIMRVTYGDATPEDAVAVAQLE